MAPPPSSPPAPRSPPAPPQRHNRTGGSKGSASLSSRTSLDKNLPGIPGLPSGAASPSIVAAPSPVILYPPIPIPATIPPPPTSKTVQYPARPPNQLPPPVPTPPATSPSSAAPSRLTSLSSTSSKYAPSPLGVSPGASSTRHPSSTSTTQSSGDEGASGNADKLRKRKKTTKKKAHSEEMAMPPATLPVRYPSMVLSRLVREEAENAANSSWIGVPPQRSNTVPTNMGAHRPASMILYRLADEEDRVWATEGQLSRPASNHSLAPPPGNRFTANPRLSVSPSFDSKYPSFPVTGDGSPNSPPLALSGYATPPGSRPNSAYRNSTGTPPPGSTPLSQGVFLPYEYDPTEDEIGPNDSVDDLHHIVLELGSDGKYKFPKERMADLNARGLMNVICIAFVISAILAVFLAYPVVDAVQRQRAYEAAQQGAVIVNPVPPKDGTSLIDGATSTDDGSLLTSTDPLSTSRTRTRTTADPTPTTDENGDPIQTDTGLPGLTTPTPTPTPTPTLPGASTVATGIATDTGTDTGALRKRIPQPTALVIAARRERQARS